MLNINSHQENANQNYNEVSPQTGHSGHHQKALKRINTAEDVQKRESSYNLGGNINCEATMEKPWRFLETLNTEVSYDPAIPLASLDLEKFIN